MKYQPTLSQKLIRCLLVLVFLMGILTTVGTSDDDDNDNNTTIDDTPGDTTDQTANTAPVAAIVVPADATVYAEGAYVTLAGTGTDTEDGALSGDQLFWTSSIDGNIGIGSTRNSVRLSTGTHIITLTATDTKGASHGATISLTLNPVGNTLPTAEISAPSDGDTFSAGEYITFTGLGADNEDGDLTGSSLVWTSNKNKQIGVGASFETDTLESGVHLITLTATDSAGTKTSTAISITITNTLPVATINWPADGDEFNVGEPIQCTGTGYDEEDGNLSGTSLVWRVDGQKVGEGNSCEFDYLTAGDHIIALYVTDNAGETDVDSIDITVQ